MKTAPDTEFEKGVCWFFGKLLTSDLLTDQAKRDVMRTFDRDYYTRGYSIITQEALHALNAITLAPSA